jgi:type II secretory pathway component GspD/PulD (secretin)
MKRLFMFLLMLPVYVFAAPITFNFNDVSLVAFSQSTFKNLLRVDYVIAPDVLAMDRKITLSVANIDDTKVLEFVEGILQQQGIGVDVRQGVYYLVPLAKSAQAQEGANASAKLPAPLPKSDRLSLHPSAELAGADALPARRAKDDESEIYTPQNRPSDFLVSLIVSSFGSRSAVAAGGDLLITGSKEDLEKMRKLLDAVDSLPKLVDVSASWIEVTDNSSDGRGISLLATVLGAKLGVTVGSVNSGSAVSFKSSKFELVIDALKTDGRFKQVSNSRVVGDDYEKLVLTVGDETPTISSTGKDNSGNTVQNVVYRPSGVIVDVQPKVLGNGRIQLLVDGQISNFKTTATGVTGSPTLVKRQVKTKVTLTDGEVLLIGGLNDKQSSGASSALSFLPAWASKSSSSAQTDLVLILSAKVVKAE